MNINFLDLTTIDEDAKRRMQQIQHSDRQQRISTVVPVIKRLLRLRMEGLRLYQALPEAERFHAATAKWRLLEGGNRSGKTEAGAAELSRAVCGCDPYNKYPKTNGVALVVGLKEDNVAMIWAKVSEPGSFKIIPDEMTKLYRAVRPDPNNPLEIDPYDLAYRERWRDAPPLIPARMLAGNPAMDNAARNIPRTVNLVTGWRIEFRPSGSRPDQGDHYNLVWNDEEMEKEAWYTEEVRGLTGLAEIPEHTPRGFWTATSQVANPAVRSLRTRAKDGDDDVARFSMIVDQNPYVSAKERQVLYNSFLTEEDRQTRYYGVPAEMLRHIYPTYDPMGIHGCDPFEIDNSLWARFVVIDPSTQRCAILFGAVDPDEKYVWIYDVIDLRRATREQVAQEIRAHQGSHKFEAIVFDCRAGDQKSFNASRTVAAKFWAALEEAGVETRIHGPHYGFIPSMADVEARTMALQSMLAIRDSGPFRGTSRLQVMRGKLPPAFDKEIREARTEFDPKRSHKRVKAQCDMLDCLEYFAAYDPHYAVPELVDKQREPTPIEKFLAKKRNRRNPNRRVYV